MTVFFLLAYILLFMFFDSSVSPLLLSFALNEWAYSRHALNISVIFNYIYDLYS